ncbi:Uma2 family endonuclease [Thauera aromatica]|uniref:Uma2 family endonuclease n=1 Tax=Thauera aromatica TaxID=59405 RepID=UPI001FFDCF33|nr:Uma2 family endonuclease [Thauera aromatica]MCK2088529.1 Uma2 family endonuclease [Thauera aromatica]
MSLPAAKRAMNLDAFLAWEGQQPERWEFVDGEAFVMAGGTDVPNTITGNTYIALRNALRGTRRSVFMTNVRLRLAADDSLFYPDDSATTDTPT